MTELYETARHRAVQEEIVQCLADWYGYSVMHFAPRAHVDAMLYTTLLHESNVPRFLVEAKERNIVPGKDHPTYKVDRSKVDAGLYCARHLLVPFVIALKLADDSIMACEMRHDDALQWLTYDPEWAGRSGRNAVRDKEEAAVIPWLQFRRYR